MLTEHGEIDDSLIESVISSGDNDGNKWERVDFIYQGSPIKVSDGNGGFHQTILNLFPKSLSVFGEQGNING